jgi:hypothetical protein
VKEASTSESPFFWIKTIFATHCGTQGYVLGSQLFEIFILRHAATVADQPVIPQLHRPSE